jgi:preprotein translocase subunit YajC
MIQGFLYLLEALSPIIGDSIAAPILPAQVGETATAVGQVAEPINEPTGLFGGSLWIIVIYAGIFVGAYFLLMRPQRKREKKMKELQSTIKTGDDVITSGGFFGRVADVGEDCFIIEFGTNRGIRIPVQKSDVLGILDYRNKILIFDVNINVIIILLNEDGRRGK